MKMKQRGFIKFSQEELNHMAGILGVRKELPANLKPGASVEFKYVFDGINIQDKGLVIAIRKTMTCYKVKILTSNSVIFNVPYSDFINIKVLKQQVKKVNRAKLYYLIK